MFCDLRTAGVRVFRPALHGRGDDVHLPEPAAEVLHQ